MVGKTAVLAAVIALFGVRAALAAEPQPLEFRPAGGGSFIYCNNPEAIDSATLVNGGAPRYIMNNEALAPGIYYLYLSHYNFIGMTNGADKVSADMELDVELTPATESCTYAISRVGFETITTRAWYENGVKRLDMAEWGQFNCCAETMERTLVEADGSAVYKFNGSTATKTVTETKTRWLSEFTPNYAKVRYREPVHYQAVLEIKSGKLDVNVCAFRSEGELGDRSTFCTDAENGIVRYDRTIKGIADTLPQVTAELEYEIDDSDADGSYLPVVSYNQYATGGAELNEWNTHISPLDDPWAKAAADESGMLAFEYRDKSKLDFYGSAVLDGDKTDIWYFDTHHTDTHSYENQPGAGTEDKYRPNYEITVEDNASGYAVNLGNYGVTYTYNLKIKNGGSRDRYFCYEPTTGSKLIVYTDEKGKKPGYGLVKRGWYSLVKETMSVVKLPSGKTTEFSLNVTLPVNYNGGTLNAFVIRDNAAEIDFDALISNAPDREYVKPIDGRYLSEYRDKLPETTLEAFSGTLDCYEVLKCGNFYAARWCEWDGSPNSYAASWQMCSHVYILDKSFNITGYHTFDSLPVDMSRSVSPESCLYIKTADGAVWSSADGEDWNRETALTELPKYKEVITLGDVMSDRPNKAAACGEEVTLDRGDSERLYMAIKDIELAPYRKPAGQTGRSYPTIDNVDLFNVFLGIEYNGEYYCIASDNDRDRLMSIIAQVVLFGKYSSNSYAVSEWAYNDAQNAAYYGFIPLSVYECGRKFTERITRELFCDTAERVIRFGGIADPPEPQRNMFSDMNVLPASAAERLAALGVINGYEDGTFRPDNEITREEAAVILARILTLMNMSEDGGTAYADNEEIQPWARDAVGIVSRNGIMNGIDAEHFDPRGGYTIEQAIVTLVRIYDKAVDAGLRDLNDLTDGGEYYVLYREARRNNRLELATYDTEPDSALVIGDTVSVSGSYKNDRKFYPCCGKWTLFETDYREISSGPSQVITSGNRKQSGI